MQRRLRDGRVAHRRECQPPESPVAGPVHLLDDLFEIGHGCLFDHADQPPAGLVDHVRLPAVVRPDAGHTQLRGVVLVVGAEERRAGALVSLQEHLRGDALPVHLRYAPVEVPGSFHPARCDGPFGVYDFQLRGRIDADLGRDPEVLLLLFDQSLEIVVVARLEIVAIRLHLRPRMTVSGHDRQLRHESPPIEPGNSRARLGTDMVEPDMGEVVKCG